MFTDGYAFRQPPSVLPDISPSRGEIGRKHGRRFHQYRREGRNVAPVQSPPL